MDVEKMSNSLGGGSKCRTLGAGSFHHRPPCNIWKDFDMSQSKTDTCSFHVLFCPLSSFCLFLSRSISRTETIGLSHNSAIPHKAMPGAKRPTTLKRR